RFLLEAASGIPPGAGAEPQDAADQRAVRCRTADRCVRLSVRLGGGGAPKSPISSSVFAGAVLECLPDEPMTADAIATEFQTIVNEDGPWTSASFEVAPGLWTFEQSPWNWLRAKYALDNACLMLGKAPKDLRVLDLGCLEGQIAINLAQMGCTVVG